MGLFDRFKKKVKSVIDETDSDALSAPDDSEEAAQALANKDSLDDSSSESIPEPESESDSDEDWDEIEEESEPVVEDEWDDWDDDEESEITSVLSELVTLEEAETETESVSDEPTPVARGPPGGGKLIRGDVDEEQSAGAKPARGPPGGGKLVRERIAPSERSRISDSKDLPTEILKPVRRPVLQPKSSETANIKSSTSTTKVMIPVESPKVAKLTPVKTTLTALPSSEEEE